MTPCADCGARGADRELRCLDRRLASDLRYCRECYERLAARIMRPHDERPEVLEMVGKKPGAEKKYKGPDGF